MENLQLMSIVEALVMASPEPLPARRIAQVVEDATVARITGTVEALNARYAETGSSFRIREIAGGFQFHILPDYIGYVEELFTRHRKMRLTRAALETIAIIAYRQPVTKTEVEHIRGVACDGVLQNLVEKNMITIVGRAKTVGKPLQYGTTDEFLKFFGLNAIESLPKMTEIEELVASRQPVPQQELELATEPEPGEQKLNIADGTFDPAKRDEYDELISAASPASIETPTSTKLTITSGPQENDFQNGEGEAEQEPVITGEWEASEKAE
jgi:segregation and condensation protein B